MLQGAYLSSPILSSYTTPLPSLLSTTLLPVSSFVCYWLFGPGCPYCISSPHLQEAEVGVLLFPSRAVSPHEALTYAGHQQGGGSLELISLCSIHDTVQWAYSKLFIPFSHFVFTSSGQRETQ